MRTFQLFVAGAVAAALAGCGAEEISSAGSGGSITINYPQVPAPTPTTPDPPSSQAVTPAGGCPTIANPVGASR